MSTDPTTSRIAKRSLSDQAAAIIRERIFFLALKPGSRLVVDILAEELNVSRTPVREALRDLSSEGVVSYDGSQYKVRKYSQQDIAEVYEIRHALEVLAVQLSAERINAAAIEELRRICAEVGEKIGAHDMDTLVALDIRFHEIVTESSGNSRLIKLLNRLRQQVQYIHRLVNHHPGLMQTAELETLKEHQAILLALEARDLDAAVRRMTEHLSKGEQRAMQTYE